MRILMWAVGALILAGFMSVAYVGVRPPLLFFPDRVVTFRPDHGRNPMTFEDVRFTTLDQVEITGWWVPADDDDAPTILYLHGPIGDLGDQLTWIRLARDSGFHVFAIDYRGFGESQGSPSVSGLYRDAEAAYRWLIDEKGVTPDNLIILGRALGGAVAAHLAQQHTSALVVLESTFTRVTDVAKQRFEREFGSAPPNAVLRLIYWNANMNTLRRVAEINAPILVLHSREDEAMPFAYGEALVAAAGENATLKEVRGRHRSIIDSTGTAYFVPVRSAFEAARRQY